MDFLDLVIDVWVYAEEFSFGAGGAVEDLVDGMKLRKHQLVLRDHFMDVIDKIEVVPKIGLVFRCQVPFAFVMLVPVLVVSFKVGSVLIIDLRGVR